jgi:hypothetical protein
VACLAYPISPITKPIAIFTFFVSLTSNHSLIDEYFSCWKVVPSSGKDMDMGIFLGSILTTTALHCTTQISCGPFPIPHSAFDPTEKSTVLGSFSLRGSSCRAGNVYRTYIPGMNRRPQILSSALSPQATKPTTTHPEVSSYQDIGFHRPSHPAF